MLRVLLKQTHTYAQALKACLPWRLRTSLVDASDTVVVSAFLSVDLDSGHPSPSLGLISCSGRRVSVDCGETRHNEARGCGQLDH